jgi:predicted phage replisome organizer
VGDPAIWIKISTGTFDDDKIGIIGSMPSGDKMIITWFKLLLLAGKCNAGGYLLLQEDMPFTKEMLASKFKEDISIIELSLSVFERFRMIQRTSEGIYITNFNKYQDLDKMNQKRLQDKERQQKHREKKRLLIDSHKDEVIAAEEERDMSLMISQKNDCDLVRDSSCDSSYSTSTSSSSSNSKSNIKLDSDNSNYIEFFNINFYKIKEFERKLLSSCEKKGMNPLVITLALTEAAEKNARNFSYVKKILVRWLEKNILTVDAVMADKEQFQRKKNAEHESTKKVNGKPSTFNNFQQREYDYDSLEKKLLGWDRTLQPAAVES